jgi:glutaredoxin
MHSSKLPVLIYSKPGCSFCEKAKDFLESHDIPFDELELNQDVSLSKYDMYVTHLKSTTGHKTFPFIFVGDKFIGGYDDMIESYNMGQLSEILSQHNIHIKTPSF